MKTPFEPLLFPFDEEMIDGNEILQSLTTASAALGKLDMKMRQTHDINSTYALSHLTKIESLYSTKIEGTQTTMEAVYEAESNTNTQKQGDDIKEVLRYVEALKVASSSVRENPITNSLIQKVHKILLEGDIRKNSNFIAGEFRTQQNKVGEHIPPIAARVEEYMGNLERYMNDDYGYNDNLPPIIKAALIHAQFETIHPFPDGNGRVGRVLIPIYLYKQNLISSPYMFLSRELERNRIRYYSYLQGTRTKTKDGFTQWITFFLNSITNQAENDVEFIDKLDILHNEVLRRLKNEINSNKIDIIIEAMFKSPIFTIDGLHKQTNISKSTLRTYVKKICDMNIVFGEQKERNKRFYFMELIDIVSR